MNIFLREMKANRKSLIIWCIGVLFMIGAGMAKYTAFATTGEDVNAIFSQLPKAMLAMFGMIGMDLSKASSFYAVIYILVVVMAAIHAGMLGAGIIAKEERDKTSEFLYVKPISRQNIITSKISAALVNIVILNLFTLVSSIGIMAKMGNGEDITTAILIMMLGMLILQVLFMFIGAGLAALSKKPRSAGSLAAGIILGTYLLYVVIQMNDKLEWLRFLSPFTYFQASDIILNTNLELPYAVLSLAIAAVFGVVTYIFYKKKDLSL